MTKPDVSLHGRRAVVTGAASGIGKAIADRFAAAGAQVVGLDIHPADDQIQCDVSDEASVVAAFDRIRADGLVTDVVHAAGIAAFGPIRQLALADWRRILDVNLTGSFLIGREAARALRKGGTLTFISSQGGLRGSGQWAAYCSSKFGVVGLSQSIARELAPEGIRVNAVCPGGVRTPMADASIAEEAARRGVPQEVVFAEHNGRIPLGGEATAEQVADVCVFLASSLASHVAGSSIVVNGAE